MAKGGTWSGSYTVPGEAAGYYSVLANAYTHGPGGGAWLFDDVSRSAWMYVSETDGQLTRHFEESLFPDRDPSGARTGDGVRRGLSAARAGPPPGLCGHWHRRLACTSRWSTTTSRRKRASSLRWAWRSTAKRRGGESLRASSRYAVVPEDGIVSFRCPPWDGHGAARYLEGKGRVPETDYVRGRDEDVLDYWRAGNSDCGRLKTVHVDHDWYLAWRHLDVGGERISKHFGHYRQNPVKWNVNFAEDARAKYNWYLDKITMRANFVEEGYAKWVAAHEYGHALHEKALGGLWWETFACSGHTLWKPSSHRCAMQEGFADYAGTIGSGGHYEECFEHFGDPGFPMSKENKYQEGICRQNTGPKPKIEGRIAALLLDLTDDTGEEGDDTEYPGKYVAEVFKTCRTKITYKWMWNPVTGWSYYYIWWARTNVSNIVWCLEEEITPIYHEEDSVFGDIGRPWDVRVVAEHPPNRSIYDIRQTWLHNLN